MSTEQFDAIANFLSPGSTFRGIPLWSWNDRLEEREVRRQIRAMADGGLGGFFMHARVGLLTPYLDNEWFDMVRVCIDEAKRLGMHAWIYDEDKWPSGYAGGRIAAYGKEHRLKGIYAERSATAAPGDPVLRSFRFRGEEWVIAVHTDGLGQKWFNESAYVDLMNPETVRLFLDTTIGAYYEAVGSEFGKTVPGVFTDEPCYQFFGFRKGLLPWTHSLPDVFRDLHGYELVDWIELLFLDAHSAKRTDGPPGTAPGVAVEQRVRHDFFAAATHRFLTSFTQQYQSRANELGLVFTGHFMSEDTLESQTSWIGAAMPHYEFMDWPGIDKLGRHVNQNVTVKQVSSVSDQLEKERTFSEVFGCVGQDFSFAGQRWIHGWQVALGVNVLDPHLSLYTMAGERKRDFPANLFYQQPWWKHQRVASDVLARLNAIMTWGQRVIDVGVLHPIASAWALYDVSSYSQLRENPVAQYDRWLTSLTDGLLERQIDFHFIDETLLARHGRVDIDSAKPLLTVGAGQYRIVIVPPSITWSATTIELLSRFCASGGVVWTLNQEAEWIDMATPLDLEELLPDRKHASTISALIAGIDADRSDAFVVKVLDRDLGNNVPSVFIHERTENGAQLAYLTNTSETRHVRIQIFLPFNQAWILDPQSGSRRRATFDSANGENWIDMDLAPGEPVILVDDSDAWSEIPEETASWQVSLTRQQKHEARYRLTPSIQGTRLRDPNVMPIERVDLWIDGSFVGKNMPLLRVWDEHFYGKPDGTQFRARYNFRLDGEIPEKSGMSVAVERAINLDQITINGSPVKADGTWWLDPNFQLLDIARFVVSGGNTLEIVGRKFNNITKGGDGVGYHRLLSPEQAKDYRPTDLDAAYIVGDFLVPIDRVGGSEIVPVAHSRLEEMQIPGGDITSAGFPFYAGTVEIHATVDLAEHLGVPFQAAVSIERVTFPSCELWCNGKHVDTRVWEPWEWDVSQFLRPGTNELRFVLPTDLYNLMGPATEAYDRPEMVGPDTFRSIRTWSPVRRSLSRLVQGLGVAIWPRNGGHT